ncbi:MAG TPA: phage portal protein [Nocardioidaceae bacterium]|nr:phage portal protein [Nocardioidaceae bacterium]
MSLFFRNREEKRAITGLPWIAGGDYGSNISQEKALTLAPVFAANRHITDFASTLPLKSYRKLGDNERQPMDSLPQLFRDLETRGELVPWLSSGVSSLVLRGNAVGLIAGSDGFGFPTNVTWLSMDRVWVDDSTGVGRWYVDGRQVSRLDLVHIPWITIPGHTLALSPIAYFARTINAGLDAQQYGGDWFQGGGFPPSVFKNLEKPVVDGAAADAVRERLKRALKKREPFVTGKDWEFTPITIPPSEAQFIETQKLSANQIASIYGIAPEECGGEPAGSLTYLNEEHRQTVRAHNLSPYLARFERAFASWLPDKQFVRFNVDAIVRADIKTRHEVYRIQSDIGLTTTNERRAHEDLSPIDGGDVLPAKKPPEEPRRLTVVQPEEGSG